jgi:hypothetical protein
VGFAYALESISNSVCIFDALEDAASESRALMVSELKDDNSPEAEEKAKTGGIFETIKKNVAKVWEFVIRMGRRIMDFIRQVIELAKPVSLSSVDLAQLNQYLQDGWKGTILDEEFSKLTHVSNPQILIPAANATLETIERLHTLLDVYPGFARTVVNCANELGNNQAQRQATIDATNKMIDTIGHTFGGRNDSLPEDMKVMISNKSAEIKASPMLLGGNYVWLEVERPEGKMPKASIHLNRSREEVKPVELPVIPGQILKKLEPIVGIYFDTSRKRMTEVGAIVKNLKNAAPNGFANVDGIEEGAVFASAAVGVLGGLTAQLCALVHRGLVVRTINVFDRWIVLSLAAHKKHMAEKNVGGTGSEDAGKANAAEGAAQANANAS